ncbi:TonB family protein [Sphingomonas sp. CFBP9019]|uniref:TonB family protein n=1 Tax=Sphingomonas sp. CFBP9019 TaxID=3096532 RepID=UPI0009E07A4F|nr:TonB family protein [Sphingomonas sp. CFBP9019]MDY1007345.1 TonB family protein [Sphingomonas sp. CFBP9019]
MHLDLVSAVLVAAAAVPSAAPVQGDFDGDGRSDTASIVGNAEGSFDVVVRFATGRIAVADSGVDDAARLTTILAARVRQSCAPLARSAPECSGALSPRDGLYFKRTRGDVASLAIWSRGNFTKIFGLSVRDLAATGPAASAPPGTVRTPATLLSLAISAEGKVTACTIAESSGNAALDQKACAIMLAKAKFRPAMDRRGQPVMTTKRIRLSWAIDRAGVMHTPVSGGSVDTNAAMTDGGTRRAGPTNGMLAVPSAIQTQTASASVGRPVARQEPPGQTTAERFEQARKAVQPVRGRDPIYGATISD